MLVSDPTMQARSERASVVVMESSELVPLTDSFGMEAMKERRDFRGCLAGSVTVAEIEADARAEEEDEKEDEEEGDTRTRTQPNLFLEVVVGCGP